MMLTSSGFSKSSNKYYVNERLRRKKTDVSNQRKLIKYEYTTDIFDNLIKHYIVLDQTKYHNDQDLNRHRIERSLRNSVQNSSSLPSIKSYIIAKVRKLLNKVLFFNPFKVF